MKVIELADWIAKLREAENETENISARMKVRYVRERLQFLFKNLEMKVKVK